MQAVRLYYTGRMDGDEVSQVYMKIPSSGIVMPIKELKGFQRSTLKKGVTKNVEINIRKDLLRYWDDAMEAFVTPKGNYEFMIGTSSQDIQLTKSFTLD